MDPARAIAALTDGRIALVEQVGEGGMSTVYRAWDAAGQFWCAVKVLRANLTHSEPLRRRFEREAAALGRLDHPNIVGVRECGLDAALPYIVMDLVEGGSLHDRVARDGPLPPRMAAAAMAGVCAGLGAAHAAGIVHRDVKPGNVLVERDGRCRLGDFGIAWMESDTLLTRAGVTMGTTGFMAPEQSGDAHSVDHRADIYSLGATLLWILTADRIDDPIATLERAGARVPDPLGRIVARATMRSPAHRPESADRVAEALRRAEPHLPSIPEGTPALFQAQRWVGTLEPTGPTFVPDDLTRGGGA